jgi:hypothetical protein
MISLFYCSGVVTVFPECTFAILSLVVFLSGSPSNQLQAFGNSVSASIVKDKQMNMI